MPVIHLPDDDYPMATVMEFTSPVAEFPLGSVFENLPGVTVELERLIPHETLIIPYFWVRGADAEDIEAAFEPHVGVSNIRLVDNVEDEYLMRAEWEQEYFGILSALAKANVVVLAGIGTKDEWRFEVRGESQEAIAEFRDYCQENDIPISITAVHAMLPIQGEGYELTETQREALVLAYERGYFDSPRRASLEEIADELGITHQSLSSRLRRGHRRLIGATLSSSL
jgi:predicted DNA binding protein